MSPRLRPGYLQGCPTAQPTDAGCQYRPSGKTKCVSATPPTDAGPPKGEDKPPSTMLVAQVANPFLNRHPMYFPCHVLLSPGPFRRLVSDFCTTSTASLCSSGTHTHRAKKTRKSFLQLAAASSGSQGATTSLPCSTRTHSSPTPQSSLSLNLPQAKVKVCESVCKCV